jgi:hypothetical protein
VVATTLVAVSLPLAATSAWAVGINNPPVLPHTIISFPQRDFVSAAGYAAGDRPVVQVMRGTTRIGFTLPVVPQDDPKTVGFFDGLVDVNHPGGACWEGTTPSIQPGDVIQVLTAPGTGDQTTTANVTVTQKATKVNANTVTLKGTAVSATGGQIPIAQIEARVVANQQSFLRSGKRTVRADATGAADGTLAYDSPTATTWTATFTGMGGVSTVDNISDADRAVASESRMLWLGVNTATGQELTIFEAGGPTPATKGPAAPCGAPSTPTPSIPNMMALSDSGISSLDNITNKTRPTFDGTTGDPLATSATLYVDDVVNATTPVSGGKYSLVPTGALASGQHTIKVSETAPGATESMSPGFLPITIDVTKPIITKVGPAVNATGVHRTNNIAAIFNERVNTVGTSSYALRKTSTHGLLTSVVTYATATRQAVLNPSTTLLSKTTYTVTLSSLIKDTAGNVLTAKVYNFTTGAVL